MPPGAKKRKAAKKKQEQQQQQQASTTQPNLKSNYDSRSQEESDVSKKAGFTEEGGVRIEKEQNLDTDERIEIIDSSHDHDKSSSSSSSGSSSNSSDDESREVKKESEVITVSSVEPDQPVPIAADAPFMGATANVIVESTGLMDSAATGSDPRAEEQIEISHVETVISNKADKISLPKPDETSAEVSLVTDETKQASSSEVNEVKTSPLPKSSGVPEDIRESEVAISHEEEAPVRSAHGVVQRTSWLSCCGLFDVMSGSSR